MMVAERMRGGMSLKSLLQGIASVQPNDDREVTGVTLDSRQIVPGTLFVACAGEHHHGLAFAEQALSQGAEAIVWEADGEQGQRLAASLKLPIPLLAVAQLSQYVSRIAGRFYRHPSRNMTVYGITGTNGKTSISQLLAHALSREEPCGIMGTLGVGLPGQLTPTGYTTPDAVTLQRYLHELLQQGVGAVSMEVSSHALAQDRAAAVAFDCAIFSNLSRDHFDYHGTLENYASAKQRLFRVPDLSSAVVNLDDSFGRTLIGSMAQGVKLLGYSLEPTVELPAGLDGWARALEIKPSAEGMRIEVSTHVGEAVLETKLIGRFNAANLLAVLLALLQRGWSLHRSVEVLAQLHTVPGRMELLGGGELPSVLVDYAHTPDALEKALQTLRVHCPGSLSVVFGCGGDRDRGKRPLMGELAERLADRVIITDDNPRSESSSEIIQQILAGMKAPDGALVEADRRRAIRTAVAHASPGDLVLVAGKGHEDYQLVGEKVLHFDDREEVADALDGWSGVTQ
ncbi:MAG: UDP-N-acetylmuramoyl-L-alanyl-D-glutamate--2,6-diaminopimelate ligase [Candidatus Thiodiazotropha sp.]|jgi:UDP-N-acetylmuramoyl-L-alanyl-D-glutamate--2,6-diaminopimelate ligase